jgi:hypothetical protein
VEKAKLAPIRESADINKRKCSMHNRDVKGNPPAEHACGKLLNLEAGTGLKERPGTGTRETKQPKKDSIE